MRTIIEKPKEVKWRFWSIVQCVGDIYDTRECKLTITKQLHGSGPLHRVGHFRCMISPSDGGMAFPEVLREYAKLFSEAADCFEGKEPIDFQI